MNLPLGFIRTIQNAFGDEGRAYLSALPGLIDEASQRWGLSEVRALPDLSYNFVAFARRGADEVVLKIGVPDRELRSEIAALRFFAGHGTVLLLEADERRGMFLLERLRPGEQLSTLRDDEQATRIAAQVMMALWKPAPPDDALIQLSDWFKGFEKLRLRFEGGTGPLQKGLVERAEAAAREFFAEKYVPMLIHGDLHHFNILSSSRFVPPGWLVIDPKGVVGPAAYEVGPLLINPWPDFQKWPEARQITERRIAILSEQLGFERERIRAWGIAHAVLSAWWSLEEGGDWEYAMGCAEILSRI